MLLKYLVTNLIIVCFFPIFNDALSSENDDLFCAHDGYFNGTVCICESDFSGENCTMRNCRNGGVNVDDRCICPLGFIGQNCQPVKCVDGSQNVWQRMNHEKTISLLATYNYNLNNSWKNQDMIDIVCGYQDYRRNFVFFENNYLFNSTKEDCITQMTKIKTNEIDYCGHNEVDKDTFEQDNCKPLDVASILKIVTDSTPDSVVFVATNVNVNISTSTQSIITEIIQTAISRRIQINVVAYESINLLFNSSDPGMLILQDIAKSTLGNFVFRDNIPATQNEIIIKLLDHWTEGIQVVSIGIKNLPFYTLGDIYISAQAAPENLVVNGNKNYTKVAGNNYWQLIKLDVSYTTLTITGQDGASFPLIYSSNPLSAYSAFTSDDSVDAAFSVTNFEANYPLVLRVVQNGTVLNSENIKSIISIFANGNTNIECGSKKDRSSCQFNIKVDSSCIPPGPAFILIRTDSNNVAIIPTFRSENQVEDITNVNENVISDNRINYNINDFTCGLEADVEKFGSRSFVLIAQNTKDSNINNSNVDNVFWNKNSIFNNLYVYINTAKQPHYSNYYSVLLKTSDDGSLQGTTKNSTLYNIFQTKVMQETDSSNIHTNDDNGPFDISEILITSINSINKFSDIFLIINFNITIAQDRNVEIYKAIEQYRSRLYIILMQTYTQYSNDQYSYINDFAVRSGGFAFRLNSYDDMHQFFEQYYPTLVTNDIVSMGYSEIGQRGILLSDVYLSNQKYQLLISNQGSLEANISLSGENDDVNISKINQFGELSIWCIDNTKSGKYGIKVRFNENAEKINVVLFDDTDSQDIVSLSFLNQKNGENQNNVVYGEGSYQPLLYSSNNETISDLTITYSHFTSAFEPIYSDNVTNNDICPSYSNFTYTVPFNWTCSDSNGIYHIKIDVNNINNSISRTFRVTCVGDTSKCLNDGVLNENNSCNCALGWTGEVCAIPICQNGGSRTNGNTCNCTPEFDGFFCEKLKLLCSDSPKIADYRSDLSSLIIVADVKSLAVTQITTAFDLPGITTTVILYGDDQDPRIVLSTANTELLPQVLSGNFSQSEGSDPTIELNNALKMAFNSQITNRAMILVLTSISNFSENNFDYEEISMKLSSQRAELRFLTTNTTIGNSLQTLGLLGNGIVGVLNEQESFQNYAKYLSMVFSAISLNHTAFNVYDTNIIDTNETTISFDKDDENIESQTILHVWNGNIDQPSLVSDTSYSIYDISNLVATKTNLIIKKQNETYENFMYSIEKLNRLKTSYGFNQNMTDEKINIGAISGFNNTIQIYSVPSFDDLQWGNPETMPYLRIRDVTKLEDITTLSMTRKNNTCFYSYFAVLPECSARGYLVQLITRSRNNMERKQQFSVICHTTDGCNKNNTNKKLNGTCICNEYWSGISCTEPICQNEGISDGRICRCSPPYYGQFCENNYNGFYSSTTVSEITSTNKPATSIMTTIPTEVPTTENPKPTFRLAAFIMDVTVTDDYAFNQTIKSILTYVGAFNDTTYVSLTSNGDYCNNSIPFRTFTSAELSDSLASFYGIRGYNNKSNVTRALQDIKSFYTTNFKNSTSANIFYLPQNSLEEKPDVQLDDFKKSSILYSKFASNASDDVMNSLKNFSSITYNVWDYYTGFTAMVNETAENGDANYPTKPTFSCVYGLQANIMIGIDHSATLSNITEKLEQFLNKFNTLFNYIELDTNWCSQNTSFSYSNERTMFASFIYYNNSMSSPSYCPSSYNLSKNSKITGNSAPTLDYDITKHMAKFINWETCACSRYNDENTYKFMIWLPRAEVIEDDNATLSTNLKYNSANSYHFVVPFYDVDTEKNDIYSNILKTNAGNRNSSYYLLSNAATNSIDTIINDLTLKLCSIGNIDPIN